MTKEEPIPLLGIYDILPEDLSRWEAEKEIQEVLTQLVIERAREVGVAFNRRHQTKINHSKVFGNLTEYFRYSGDISGNPHSAFQEWLIRSETIFSKGFMESVWNQELNLWVPLIFVKDRQWGGQAWFTQVLLHELQHAADSVVEPETEEDRKHESDKIRSVHLALFVVWMTLLGKLLLVSQQAISAPADLGLATATAFSTIAGLSQLGLYYFSDEERRAREASKRIR